MMKKNPALLDIYDASIRLDSVFFHDLTREKRMVSSFMIWHAKNVAGVQLCPTRKFWRAYTRVTVTSQCKSTWQMTSADHVNRRLLATDVVSRCPKCKCAFILEGFCASIQSSRYQKFFLMKIPQDAHYRQCFLLPKSCRKLYTGFPAIRRQQR
jgi:hypothetical protein